MFSIAWAPARRRRDARCDDFHRMGACPPPKNRPMRCFASHGRRPGGEGTPDAMISIAWAPVRRRRIARCDVLHRMGAGPAAKDRPMRCFASHGRRPAAEGSPDAMIFIAWAPARRRRIARCDDFHRMGAGPPPKDRPMR